MENNHNDYHVSFFKPVTEKARKNRNMVIWLVLIWATAVFGFQILLRVIEKPVPEPAYKAYISVWDKVQAEDANNEDLKIFANSVLTVLGKVYIKENYRTALSNALTWSVFQIADENQEQLLFALADFERKQEESDNILDASYVKAKNELENFVANILTVEANDARRVVIPFVLKTEYADVFTEENKSITASAMPLYLIHNRSVLTDTKFLGFPFHYFYTAVFLLILFIGLCWAYCVITDRRELKEKSIV